MRSTADCRQFRKLPFAGQLVVWAMRHWVRGCQLRIDVRKELARAFAEVGAARATVLLNAVMNAVVDGHRRPVEIRCPCHDEISQDEWLVLEIIARYKTNSEETLWLQLRNFLTPAGTRIVGQLLSELAVVLEDADLVVLHPLESPVSGKSESQWPATSSIH